MQSSLNLLSVCAFLALMSCTEAKEGARPIDQIEHIIIFMQENRPFDHYFGTLKGVRGFNDRTPVLLQSGKNAFHQPVNQSDLNQYMLPFRTIANETNAMCMPAPEMYYPTDIKMWNKGRVDAWNTARDPGYGMSYFTRADLPYYYTLYDAFTVGDQYFQSTFTCTNPNRMFLFTGSNGLSVGEDAVLENNEPRPGFNWTTLGEQFVESNISWKVYQQLDNFDDNAFAWFKNYQQSRPGDVLWDLGMKRSYNMIDDFRKDIENDKLPQVSFLIAPTRKSEHATNHPCAGEDYTARILKVLQENPSVYAKSAFILNYDEGGQFYDHHWVPTPPLDETEGYSSVTVEGEVNTDVLTDVPAPIGMGFRVPLLIISPWTRGNIVLSEVMDHTSVVQFVEERFGIKNPNISPWRRLVAGNMLAAFDFEHPDYTWPELPDTSKYVIDGDIECHTLPDPIIPEDQFMPQQEPGTRISRALPYQFLVSDQIDVTNNQLLLFLQNIGTSGAPLIFYDIASLATVNPKQFSLAPQAAEPLIVKQAQPITGSDSIYAFVLMGPNGFLREFRGQTSEQSCAGIQVSLSYNPSKESVILTFTKPAGVDQLTLFVEDNAYSLLSKQQIVLTDSLQTLEISTSSSGNWYDFSVFTQEENRFGCFYRRFMGRMETGKDSITDPAMGAAAHDWINYEKSTLAPSPLPSSHPKVPAALRVVHRQETPNAKMNKDAKFYTHKEEF